MLVDGKCVSECDNMITSFLCSTVHVLSSHTILMMLQC